MAALAPAACLLKAYKQSYSHNYISLAIRDSCEFYGCCLVTNRQPGVFFVYHHITAPVTYTIACESARVDIANLFDHQCA